MCVFENLKYQLSSKDHKSFMDIFSMDLFCFSEFSDRLPEERGVGGLLKGDGWECKPKFFFRFVKFNAIGFFIVILSSNGSYT